MCGSLFLVGVPPCAVLCARVCIKRQPPPPDQCGWIVRFSVSASTEIGTGRRLTLSLVLHDMFIYTYTIYLYIDIYIYFRFVLTVLVNKHSIKLSHHIRTGVVSSYKIVRRLIFIPQRCDFVKLLAIRLPPTENNPHVYFHRT